jgi:uncharacterized protein with GYD domain
MPAYVMLLKWTDQGIRDVKDTVTRSRQLTATLEKVGGKAIAIYYTQGRYDMITVGEVPNEETAMAFAVTMGKSGNVRTETLRAFSLNEMEGILKKVP